MAFDPSVTAAVTSLQAQRDKLDRAIKALLALDDGADIGTATAENEISRATHQSDARDSFTSGGGGAAGARKALRAARGRGLSAVELADAMTANGWHTPSKNRRAAARAAANRLRDDPSEHVFFENGEFVYRPPSHGQSLQQATTQGNRVS